jgi:hypothetical protein
MKKRKGQRGRNITAEQGNTFTHCTNCDFESMEDFDVCPNCCAAGKAVLANRSAAKA